MWLLLNYQLLYPTVGFVTLYSTNILSTLISGISNMTSIIGLLSIPNATLSIKKYNDEFEMLDLKLKLELVKNWLEKVEHNNNNTELIIKDNTELIYKSISESCVNISLLLLEINEKILYHNTKWCKSWRSLYLDEQIILLKKHTHILNNRLRLINLIR